MAKHVARYAVTNGLAGCYMPDHHHGAIEFTTRMGDHLAGVTAIFLAALCGLGPFFLLFCLDKWGPL